MSELLLPASVIAVHDRLSHRRQTDLQTLVAAAVTQLRSEDARRTHYQPLLDNVTVVEPIAPKNHLDGDKIIYSTHISPEAKEIAELPKLITVTTGALGKAQAFILWRTTKSKYAITSESMYPSPLAQRLRRFGLKGHVETKTLQTLSQMVDTRA